MKNPRKKWKIDDATDLLLAVIEDKANAALIVNNHDKLLEVLKDLMDAFFDMSPLEYAQSRGLGFMSDEEGEKIKERAHALISVVEKEVK